MNKIYRDMVLEEKEFKKGDLLKNCILINCALNEATIDNCKIIINSQEPEDEIIVEDKEITEDE